MAGLDNLNSSPMRRMAARTRSLETTPAATNTAIGRDGMEVYDGGVIDITNGGLNVTGTATISGTLTGDGTFTWTGPFNQSGVSTFTGEVNLNGPVDIAGLTTITGTLNVNGPMKTTGTLSVEGVTTLKNDLNVTTGKINAGSVSIDPGYFDGSLKFSNGSYVAATPNGAQFVKGSGFVTVSTSQADMGLSGVRSVIVNDIGTYMTNLPTTTSPANLYADPTTGRIFRSTA